jgi:hypothetical protein
MRARRQLTAAPPPEMRHERTPFDSIEGSLEYIGLLREAIETAKKSVAQESERASEEAASRRVEALQLIAYKLERLAWHVDGSRRLLNDLRMLKRLLLGERQPDATSKETSRPAAVGAVKRSR